ncbi:MAG: DUF2243 domain-containing protein [Parvibaculum sp.]|nr:DUF2243 domain-containing protein [Parvibaculum sp.]
MMNPTPRHEFSRRFLWAGGFLGFALGGFFDGILLHQILQWHHLLSGLRGEPFADIRFQMLADGIFHALMYLVALLGFWFLWRTRHELSATEASRAFSAFALIGFGLWHVVDAVLSHWLLGLHRVRMDSEDPLLWDLLWFLVFGVVPLIAGWMTWRGGGGGHAARGGVVASLLCLAVAASGYVATWPPRGDTQVVVYFGPEAPAERALAAVSALDGRVVWADRSGEVWAFDLPEARDARSLYRHGAWFVGTSALAGCLVAVKPPAGRV